MVSPECYVRIVILSHCEYSLERVRQSLEEEDDDDAGAVDAADADAAVADTYDASDAADDDHDAAEAVDDTYDASDADDDADAFRLCISVTLVRRHAKYTGVERYDISINSITIG